MTPLKIRLTSLLNEYSEENASNTPDFILAEYMIGYLDAYNKASRAREAWYGKSLSINKENDQRR